MADKRAGHDTDGAFTQALAAGADKFASGDFQGALTEAREALKHQPGDALAQHLMGLAFFSEDEYSLAFEIFDALTQRVGDSVAIRLNAGLAALRCGRILEGLEHLQHAVSLDANHVRSFGYLALAHFGLGDLELSQAALSEAGFVELAERVADGGGDSLSQSELERAVSGLPPQQGGDPRDAFVEVGLSGSAGNDPHGSEAEEAGAEDRGGEPLEMEATPGPPPPIRSRREPSAELPRHLMVSGEIITGKDRASNKSAQADEEQAPGDVDGPSEPTDLSVAEALSEGGADIDRAIESLDQIAPDEGLAAQSVAPAAPRAPVDPATLVQPMATSAEAPESPECADSADMADATRQSAVGGASVPAIFGVATPDLKPLECTELEAMGLPIPAIAEVVAGPVAECTDFGAVFRFGKWAEGSGTRDVAVVRQDHLMAVQGRLTGRLALRRSKGIDGEAFTVEESQFWVLGGDGVALLRGPGEKGLELLGSDVGEPLYLREESIVGFTGGAHFENGVLPGPSPGALIRFSGVGQVLVRAEGLRCFFIRPSAPAIVDAKALVGWHGDVVVCPAKAAPVGHLICEGTGTALLRI